jgi:O-antigen ligase
MLRGCLARPLTARRHVAAGVYTSRAPIARLKIASKGSADLLRLSVFGLMLVNISAIQMYLGFVRHLRAGLVLLLIAAVVAFARPSVIAWKNLRSTPAKAVIALFLLACCSAAFGLSLGGSANFILNVYARNLAFFFLLVISIRNVRDLALIIWSFVASVGVLVVLALTVLNLEPTLSGLGRLESGHGIFDANDIGMILVMALPLALLFFFNSRSLARLCSALLILGIPVAIALTGSRGAMVGLVVVGVTFLLILRRVSLIRRAMVLAGVVAGLVIGAPEGYWKQMGTLLRIEEDYNYSSEYGRKGIAMRGLGYMLQYPAFGVGVSNFNRAEGTISPIARNRVAEGLSVEWIAAHNTYVQVGAEMGAPALIIWLSLLVSGSVGLLRLRRKLPASWDQTPERRFLKECCLFIPVSFLGFMITSAFLSHAYTAVPYIIFAFLAGVLMIVHAELRKDKQPAVALVPNGTLNGRASSPRRVRSRI